MRNRSTLTPTTEKALAQFDAWAALLDPPDDAVPDDALTAKEFAEKYGLNLKTATDRLKRAVADGKFATGTKKVWTNAGMRRITHFWPKRKG